MDYKDYKELNYEAIMSKINSGDRRWDYITALRGPDRSNVNYVKLLFTCFLRGEQSYVYGIESFEEIVSSSNLEYIASTINKAIFLLSDHLIYHLKCGLSAIVHYFDGEVRQIAVYLLEMMDCTTNRTERIQTNLTKIAAIIHKEDRK